MNKRRGGSNCTGRTKEGRPCRAAATASGLCFFHGNPVKASELGRKGGRSKRQITAEDVDPVPALDSVKAVRTFVARLTDEVYSGKTLPSVARGLAPLLQLQLRVLHATDLEERLTKLERNHEQEPAQSDAPSCTSDDPHSTDVEPRRIDR